MSLTKTEITATVPAEAVTAQEMVLNQLGTESKSPFNVSVPSSISSFSTASGGCGSTVVVTGTRVTGVAISREL